MNHWASSKLSEFSCRDERLVTVPSQPVFCPWSRNEDEVLLVVFLT